MNNARFSTILLWLAFSAIPAASAPQAPVGFAETYALAKDREAVLNQLVAGSDEAFYYRGLLLQQQGKLKETDDLLAEWFRRHGNTEMREKIACRQILLRYGVDPKKSLGELADKLNLRFTDEREDAAGPDVTPSELAPDALSFERLAREKLQQQGDLDGFQDSAVPRAAALQNDPGFRHEVLQRLQQPLLPDLPQRVVQDLEAYPNQSFGALGIHNRLTLDQLEDCARLRPALLDQTAFVKACLIRLRPLAGVHLESNAAEREAYLNRLQAFAERLSPAFNPLRALIQYHRLNHDRSQGRYDRERFLAYLKLPRRAGYVNPDLLKSVARTEAFNLEATGNDAVLSLQAIVSDEALVRDYLSRFLEDADSPEAFAPYVRDAYLQKLWAETKLLAGKGDAARWTALLTPAEAEALRQRVDLEFLPQNPRFFKPGDPVRLGLAVKNVKSLLVKVYAVDLVAFWRSTGRLGFASDADLDGILPTALRTETFPEPALRRVVRNFDFPELAGRGCWVVDFIGNGRSVRAVVRKGQLLPEAVPTPDGLAVKVVDENGNTAKDAALWLDNRVYRAGADGVVLLPYAEQRRDKIVVLTSGDTASLATLSHDAETPRFQAGFHVEREALLAGKIAQVAVRPSLTLNGKPFPVGVLESPVLVVGTEDLDGAQAVREIPDFPLSDDKESTYAFQVPERLSRVTFTLRAKLRPAQGGQPADLSASAAFPVNTQDKTNRIEAFYLSRTDRGYILDLLGKTGEPRPGRAVSLTVTHRDFKEPVYFTLRTDAAGRVKLGPLTEATAIRATAESTEGNWTLPRDRCLLEGALVRPTGTPIRVPYAAPLAPGDVALLERLDDGVFLHDRTAAVRAENGFLVLEGLPEGTFNLYLYPENRVLAIRTVPPEGAEGRLREDSHRFPAASPEAVQVTRLEATGDSLRLHLANAGPRTRVHLAATRFLPETGLFADLTPFTLKDRVYAFFFNPNADFTTDRAIGDEMRYILDRQQAPHLPGNMLARPGLLLNPWAVQQTSTGTQAAGEGGGFGAVSSEGAGSGGGWGAGRGSASGKPTGGGTTLEFLAAPGVFLANLRPDASGVVSVPRASLGNAQHLSVLVADAQQSVQRDFPLAETPADYRDLRLADGLDPARRFTEQKVLRPLAKGDSLTIADITSARLVLVDDLDRLFRLFSALAPQNNLKEFAFLPKWDRLSETERAEAYDRCASHELHLFLYFKDRPWFDRVVRPALRNKLEKTFVDKFLLDEDLAAYRRPSAFERLNTLEKALLALRVPEERKAAADWIRRELELHPPSPETLSRLLDTALTAESLDTGDRLGLDAAREKAEEARKPLAAPPPPAPGPKAPAAEEEADQDDNAPDLMTVEDKAEAAPVVLPRKTVGEALKNASSLSREKAMSPGLAKRRDAPASFRQAEKTKEMAESDYYRVKPSEASPALVRPSRFWMDVIENAGAPGFRSVHALEAPGNLTETLAALALLDLPFRAEKPETATAGAAYTLKAASPALAVVREIREAAALSGATAPVLITQRFFRPDEPTVTVHGETVEKYVEGEFLPRVVYGCRVVLTNPGGLRRRLDVLLQVPRGAIPVMGKTTVSLPVQLEAYATRKIEYAFYFPRPGEFSHYPAQASAEGAPLAACETRALKVVETPSTVDRTSWSYLSQQAPPEEVLRYLREENLAAVDLDRLAWRLRDQAFYRAAVGILVSRHVYNNRLFSYAVFHDDPTLVREYLLHQNDFTDRLGPIFQSPLLDVDPVERNTYRHLEYEPLFNARAHALGQDRVILNDRLRAQYNRFLDLLAHRPALRDADCLEAAYYLLLQDRVDEGREFFRRVDSTKVQAKLQYDYCAAYLAFFTDAPASVRQLATGYKDYPVLRWRKRFGDVLNQLDEMEGRAAGQGAVDREDRARRQDALASAEPSLTLKVEGRKVILEHRNLSEIRVGFHPTDAEVLFSRDPFADDAAGQAATIKARETRVVKPAPGVAKTVLDLPPGLQQADLMVSAEGGGLVQTAACHAGALTVQVMEAFGQVKVLREGSAAPVAGAYVKVFARSQDGDVRFYKDGYTDLRGRFDYATLSTDDLDRVKRFAILVLSDSQGAVVREANPPGH